MKTRQPLPACAGTAFNIVISLADPIPCGLSAALAAEIGWTRRLDATWAGYLVRLLPVRHYERCAPRVLSVKWMPSPATAVGRHQWRRTAFPWRAPTGRRASR